MYKYLDSFTVNSKSKENEKTFYFVLVYDDNTHTTFRVFVTNEIFLGIRKTYKISDDITKILTFEKNFNNENFHCVIKKIF